ncbi:hypothetical protein TH25_04340 [Thalassospira profundimaris]|uniref:Uncharacterized protein n=1 Tax=Thalassospira profundimaris TaxID=502049 RepID=A0A367XLY8_9PROT|nr:hypothetical protein [Thalassospira profundimaris]RCK53742.1 hypothetical protein TH25_04340 [Thalassospira profundimaris]
MNSSGQRQKIKEVEHFLSQLEKRGRILVSIAAELEALADTTDVTRYRPFREQVDNFKALSLILSERLSALDNHPRKDELEDQFHKLQVLMLRLVIKTSLKFFFVMSAKPFLPLGSRELFQSELRTLYEAEKMLSDPRYKSDLDESAQDDLDMARDILEEIIQHAPALLNFSNKPAANKRKRFR